MSNSLVTINLVVLNGEKYIRHCLDGILAQSYPKELIEFNILDNGSSDNTKSIIGNYKLQIINYKFSRFNLIELEKNVGVWPGQEMLLKYSNSKYVLGLCVDVLLDKDFVKNAVAVMEKDKQIGALQAKIYKYEISSLQANKLISLQAGVIDTLGFQIFKSRRVINIGHGETDNGQFGEEKEIFGVEGACPFFRMEALEDCRINIQNSKLNIHSEIFDHDYFWYGDDFDFAWRMNIFGWKQVFAPSVIAWHDRQTTKSLKKNWLDYLFRVPVRHQIPIKKRRLDWRNNRWTIIKNDYTISVLKDLPYFLVRELMVLGYSVLFEPGIFLELPEFLKKLPKMFKKRKEIMKKAKISPEQIHKFFK